MSSLTFGAIGGCGCGPTTCTAVIYSANLGSGVNCCICTNPATSGLTFDVALDGQTSYPMGSYGTISNGTPSDGSKAFLNSGDLYLTDGSGCEWYFYFIPGSSVSSLLCWDDYNSNAYYLSTSAVTSASCGPPPTVTYSVTNSNCAPLYADGITAITFTATAGGSACDEVNCLTCSGTGYTIPTTLTVTDSQGSYTATWNGSTYWATPALCSPSVSPIALCTSGVAACNPNTQSGQAIYYYYISCVSAGEMAIFRQYYYLGPPESSCTPGYQYCPCSCNPGVASFAESHASPISVTCGSIAWSGTLTPPSAPLPDPVGGTVSFSQ